MSNSTTITGLEAMVSNLKQTGKQQLSKSELVQQINELGYDISSESFNYINRGHEHQYPAKIVHIVQKDNNLPFNSINARRDDNFYELQKIRKKYFAVHHRILWEI